MNALLYWLSHPDNTHWFVLALVLLIAELMTGTLYLLWPAVAAGITGLFALMFGWGVLPEIALFSVLTIALTAFGRPLVKNRLLATPSGPVLNERNITLVGARGSATAAFVNGAGEVKLNDTVWRAQSKDAVAAGQSVEVLSVDGTMLTVKALT